MAFYLGIKQAQELKLCPNIISVCLSSSIIRTYNNDDKRIEIYLGCTTKLSTMKELFYFHITQMVPKIVVYIRMMPVV